MTARQTAIDPPLVYTVGHAQGYYVLSVPYADATELVMDVLRHGPGVEVLSPPELRAAVRERLRQAQAVYGD